jgi:asparagine synthase (glutamine-hydrolysing)
MCGIAGRVAEQPLAPERWPRVLEALRHRGPDDAGLYHGAGVCLAHARLAILDASELGRQPMADPSGRYVIVHNGEVYNYIELRERLKKKGVVFRSGADTEVVLHSFIQWGEACLAEFNGMFAFAIWDERERRLFFARDRLGVKPFYYAVNQGRFFFASEIKALLPMDLPRSEPNLAALAYFLQFRHNDLAETIFRGVFKLPPGGQGWWQAGRLRLSAWWSPPSPEAPARTADLAELRDLLADAVRLRLRSDFPTGLFLSGGLDSSGLLAMMARFTGPLHTFTAEMPGLKAGRNIAALSRRFGNTHHAVPVGLEAAALWPRVAWQFDELCADPASLPMYLLAKQAREHVKSVFSGEGADEIFVGYERATILRWAWAAARVAPAALLRLLPALLRRVPPRWGNLFFKYYSIIAPEGIDRLRQMLSSLPSPRRAYLAVQAVLMPDETADLLLPEHAHALGIDHLATDLMAPWFTREPGPGAIGDMLRFELANRLPTDLLLKGDAMTMAHGLECRVPYLDYRLVEYALCIPLADHLGLTKNKRVLRAALAPFLPPQVTRGSKENFFVPIHQWLDVLRPGMRELLAEKRLRDQGIFRPDRVSQMIDRYRAGRLYYARPLWNLMHYQIWHNIYVENGGARPAEDAGRSFLAAAAKE